MGTLTERADDLGRRMLLAEKNVPPYAKAMPGVGESLKLTRELLALVRDIAARLEAEQ